MGPNYPEAVRLVRERRYAQAAPLLIEACRAAPAALEPWTLLALCLLCLERAADLLAIVELRQKQAGDGLRLFSACQWVGLDSSEHAAIRKIAAALPDDSALTVVARYMAGLACALDGDVDRGIGQIQEAAASIGALPSELAAEPSIATIAAEACLLANSVAVAEFERTDFRSLVAALGGVAEKLSMSDRLAAAPREKFVFLSSCDQRYLERFGETAVRAFDATGADTLYHLHIVDPAPDAGAIVARLQSRCSSLTLRYSTESYDCAAEGYTRAEFYACSRLIRLPEILAFYDRDVFMWDVDTESVTDFAKLIGAMEGCDLGYFRMKNTRLTLVSHLAAAYFANTQATRRLAGIIRNYILAKLASTPFWLLDQAAVYCASSFLGAVDCGFRVRDFAADGRGFPSHIETASSAGEKQAMRKSAAPFAAKNLVA